MKIFPPIKPSILVVDDSVANLSLVAGLLRDHYTVKIAKSGKARWCSRKTSSPT